MNVFKKMKLAFNRRGKQTEIVKAETDKSPYASIVCGDFNDVPNSNTYFNIKGNRQDAFLKQHFGIGRTYIWMAPTLRIDYILPDKNFEVKQFDLVDEDLSDHLMLVSDLKLKSKAQ
jgi:endonuclease/exonuclease/phosphatase family metal-dependent hydrolase